MELATMTAIVELIVSYTAICASAIIAVAGILVTVVKCLTNVKSAVNKLKEDTDLRDVKNNTAEIAAENKELIRCNKLLLDELTRIQNYADEKEKEK